MAGDYNKSVLVTGCSSGIGRATVDLLKDSGFRVFATARTREDIEELEQAGYETISLDVADPQSVRNCMVEVDQACEGKLFALVNNAGVGQPGALEDVTRETLEKQFQVNVFGCHQLTRLSLRLMRKQGAGRIVQMSSMLGFVAMPYIGAYSASKYALEGLSDTLRLELMGSGIFVSLVEPGPIETRFRQTATSLFAEGITAGGSPHQQAYQKMHDRYKSGKSVSKFALGPEKVADVVLKAITSKRPRARYRVTTPAVLSAVLKRLLPTWLLDKAMLRIG
ncbi:MAG: SDR family NAD(P)-dependent oxidoreductase [Gammaproteobacteria bacterium]|nr:SDR family NAD(P)-dependent oxidoreductase [Gammaproteobacteria bacterium]